MATASKNTTKKKNEEQDLQKEFEKQLNNLFSGVGNAVGTAAKQVGEKVASKATTWKPTPKANNGTTVNTNVPEGKRPSIILSPQQAAENMFAKDPQKAASTFEKLGTMLPTKLPNIIKDAAGNIQTIQVSDNTPAGRVSKQNADPVAQALAAFRSGNASVEEVYKVLDQGGKTSGWYDFEPSKEMQGLLSLKNVQENINNTSRTLWDVFGETQKNNEILSEKTRKLGEMQSKAAGKIADIYSTKPFTLMGNVFDVVEKARQDNERSIIDNPAYGSLRDDVVTNAQNTLKQLQSDQDRRRADAVEKSEEFFNRDYDQNMIGFGEDPENLRRWIYNGGMFDDDYDTVMERLNPQQQEDLRKALDDVLAAASGYSYNPDEYMNLWNQELFDTPEYQITEIEQRQAEKKKKSLAAEEKQLRKYNDIMLNAQEQTRGLEHKKVEDKGWQDPYNSVGAMERGIQTYDPDRVYSLITGGTEYQRWTAGWDNPTITNEYNNALLMDDKEKEYYKYYYENGMINEAMAFHQGLNDSGVLASRYAPIEAVRVKETAKQLPIASSIVSQGMMLADKYLAIPRTIAGWLGDESVQDPNSAWYGPAKENDLIQGATSEKLTEDFGGLAGKTYSNMMNSVRNLIGAFTSTGNKALDLFGFGAQVAQESTYKHLKDNEDYTIASLKGAVDGAFEVLEELLPYDTMLKNQGSIMRDIVRNGLSEFGEEATGAFVFDPIEESIFGENSLQDRKAEIYAAGGYYDGNEWVTLDQDKAKALKQAQVQAMREKAQQGIEQALGGMFGGTVGAVYGQVGQAAQTQNVGKRIQAANNTNEAGQSGLDQILQLAKGMKQTSQSFQMAQKIQEAAGENGKASNYQVGKLAQTIMQETGEAQQQVVRDTVQRAIRDRMAAQDVAAEKAEEYAKTIADNLLKGGRLSKEAQDLLAQDERAIETWKSFNSAVGQLGLSAAVYQATEQQRSIEDQISSLVGKTTRASSAVATEIEESIRNTNSTEEAIADFAKRMPNLMSESYAKLAQEVLKADKTAKEHKNFLDAAMKIRMAAFTLSKTVPASSLGKESAQKLYEAAKKEFEEIDRQRIKNNRILKPGEGFAVFDGARFGTAEWKEKLKAIKNSNLRTQMEVLGETARRMGMQLRFVQEANKGIWGMENGASGEIVINLNAATRKGFAHSALVTMSHEMTHWLEHNSLEGYNQLREYILDNLRSKGYDVAGHIWQTIQNQYAVLSQDMTDEEAEAGKNSEEADLDMNGALADIVARSCENLLSSRKMALELARKNPGLYGRVSTFVKDFLTRMKEAVSSMPSSLSYEAGLLVKETEKIADLWTKGFREAAENKKANEVGRTEKTGESFSLEQLDDGTKYVKLDTDQEIFDNADIDEYPSIVEKYITKRFRGRVIGNANRAYVDRRAAKEYARPANHRINDEMYEAKARTATELDNLLDAAEFIENKDDDNRHKEAVGGWDYYKSIVYVPRINKFYEGIISIEKVAKGDRFHDFSKLKDVTRAMQGHNASLAPDDVSENNIPENGRNGKSFSVEQLDREYQEAVESGNLDRATEMLMDRLAETEGIIPFNAPHGYSGQHRDIAKLIKEGTPEAVARAAADMAQFVPENGVLIPMPPHEGTVEADTDTMILANAISKLTGRPVVVALESDPRESRYQAKSEGRKGVTAAEMGFRQVKEIPEGTMPIFVDNVVGSGVTADAARTAMGGGITLAYAKGTQSKGIEGLKRATVTYDKDGKLIPLSQRFDRSIRNVNYSMEQLDQEYETARKAGDEDTMRRLINEAANRAMKDSVARYDDETLIPVTHGTNEEFNIFDTSKHGGDHGTAEGFGIYLTDRAEVSEKYGKRQISGFFNAKRLAHGNEVTIKARELTDVIRATCEEQAREIAEEEGYDNWQDALRDTWISNYIYTPDYKNMNAAYRAVADQILQQTDNDNDIIREVMAGMGIREYDRAMDFYHRILTPITGIDGMWTEWKNYEDETIANIFLAFNSNQIKSADLVTYDDQGKVIPLSQRFNRENPDIRYSVEQGDDPQPITNDRDEEIAVLLPGNTVAATQYSLDSYYELGERKKMMDQLKKAGYTEKQIKKWIGDLDNIAAIIAGDRVRYDFVADRSKKFLKPNGDVYKKTLDASTMCKKTRLYNGTFNLVQHMMPHTIFMPEDLIDLFNIMKDENLETPCGFCYVQSRRRQLGPYTKEWLGKYKGEYIPTVDEVTTSDGLEKLKVEHPQTYKDFVAAMNKKGVNNPKLVQQRTDYRGDIRKLSKSTIEYLKAIGGLRIQSFSDFEVVHMLDMMQAVMDMKAVGLTAQAYTKVPEFAWIFGRTGIKINLSLVGKGTGLDADGNLVFDNDEGIDFNEAMKLREAYSKNVGTILVGINDDHIIAAMGDDRIDFIIPFHKSGWSKAELDRMRGLSAYQDYTETQNEYQWTINEDGERVLVKADSNIDPLSYWNFKQDGTWNAERYLQECKKQGLVPKFSQFLVKNADGSYSLPQGNSQRDQNIRKGYWKTLIDFKMYDNDGVGAEQMPVEPNFNMEKAFEILEEYDGSHRQLPEDMKAAKKFVRNFKRTHPLDDVRTQYSMEQAPDMDVQAWMAGLTPGSLQTEDERALLQAWKDKRMSISLSIKRQLDYRAKIKRLENSADSLTPQEREDLVALRNKLQVQEEKQARLEKEMYQITSQEGFAGMMYQQNMVMRDFITGRTQDEINDTVDDMVHEVQRMAGEIAEARKDLEKLAEAEDLKQAQKALKGTQLNQNAKSLKKEYRSKMTENEIQARLAEMALKLAAGGNVEDIAEGARELAYDLGRLQNGYLGGAYGDLADRLKQVTIVIGKEQRDQLNAQHSSIPNLRRQLAGSGVRVVYDPELRGAGTLEDIGPGSEIHDLIPELGEDTGNMMNNLDVFVGLVQGTLKNLESKMLHDIDLDDAAMMIQGYALLASTEMQGDPAMTTQVKRLLGLAKGEGGKAGELAERLKNAQDYLKGAIDKGEQAKGLTKMLRKDVDSAISYYNKTAAVAAKVEKQKVKEGLIAQLKSEHAKALYAEQEKWKELIKKDKKARETAQDNLHLRSIINTDISRIRKLIMNETDQKNIPEEAKPLARQLLKMLGTHDFVGYRKVLLMQKKEIQAMMDALNAYEKRDGGFDAERDLRWLIIAPETEYADYDAYDQVRQDLIDIEGGLVEYRTAEGQGLISLIDRNAALKKVQKAVTEIYDVIRAKQEVEINGRRMLYNELAQQARDDMKDSRYKGEWVGATKPIGSVKSAIVYGNMTPEYFFKNLKNKTISMLWGMYHKAENQSGLEIKKAKLRLAEIAKETGFENWDQKKEYSFQLAGGGNVKMTLGEMMSLYATWQREMLNQAEVNGPEKSFHLQQGGFYVEEKPDKKAGRVIRKQSAHRVTEDDMNAIKEAMTPEQLSYVNQVVGYLSNEMAELGNEASMRMFGIKKFNEEWYFPFEMWSGEKSVKSDAGVAGTQQNRVARGSASRRRVNNAKNALVIRDFTDVAVKHINWMITYNTFAPAIETMQRVMNTKLNTGEGDDVTMQNVRTAFGAAYGSDALKYYDDFQMHINGGAARVDKTPWDLLLRTFRKISVAGSLSVTLQQPLSYIRAANMINGKYLVAALNPATWRGSKAEMEKYSGVAVIKSMGKFDMNYGESAVDYMSPQKKTGTARKVRDWIADKSTKAPEVADTVTWTRLWTACKMEQQAKNPEMDHSSDEFLEKVAERFNEVMRRTQVYDSVLVKSKNMRSTNPILRGATSFMGEPTLSINVIADAYADAVNTKGARSKLHLANAGALFLMNAVVAAAIKGIMGAGRTPDKKKTLLENFLYKFEMNLLNEANIFSNIPGYSDLISLMKGEEINDDAYSVLTKLFKAAETMEKWISGEAGDPYRYLEDSAGVILQIFSRVPAKNLMRDARAMYNWFIDKPYANRATSAGVLRYQHKDLFYNADNMLGVINTKRGDAGYQTTNAAYYERLWEATKRGDSKAAEELEEYLTLSRGVKQKDIATGLRKAIKNDAEASAEIRVSALKETGLKDTDVSKWVLEEYEAGRLTEQEAKKAYMQANPKMDENDAYFAIERKNYENETGEEVGTSDYFKLDSAMDRKDTKAVAEAEKELRSHGYSDVQINEGYEFYFKDRYKKGDITKKAAEDGLKKYVKGITNNDIFWILDRVDYQKETGRNPGSNAYYYRLYDAMDANKAELIKTAANTMMKHGYEAGSIKAAMNAKYKAIYLSGDSSKKKTVQDALEKVYRVLGFDPKDVVKKTIYAWTAPEKKSKKKK